MFNVSFLVWLSGERVTASNGIYKTSSMAIKLPSIFTFSAFMKLLVSKNSTPYATLSGGGY